jgi:hypothetical protein
MGEPIMRNLLAFLMALLLVVAGLGWYLDWFKVTKSPGSDGHTTLSIDLNSVKAYQDLSKAANKGAELLDKKAKDAEANAEADTKAKAEKPAAKDPQAQHNGWFN